MDHPPQPPQAFFGFHAAAAAAASAVHFGFKQSLKLMHPLVLFLRPSAVHNRIRLSNTSVFIYEQGNSSAFTLLLFQKLLLRRDPPETLIGSKLGVCPNREIPRGVYVKA